MEKISFTVDLKEKITSGIKKIVAGFAKAADSAHDFQQRMDKTVSTAKRLESVCSKMKIPDFNALQMVAERVCDGFVVATESGMVFEQSIADLQSITGIAGKDVSGMNGNDVAELVTFMWCCAKSASSADGVDMPLGLEAFADALEPGDMDAFNATIDESEKKTAEPKA